MMADSSSAEYFLLLLLIQFLRFRLDSFESGRRRNRSTHFIRRRRLSSIYRSSKNRFALFSWLTSSLVNGIGRTIWSLPREDTWWTHTATTLWSEKEWIENLRVSRDTFLLLCNILLPHIGKKDTNFRKAVGVDKRVALTLWRLATNIELRSLSHLFGVGRSTVCVIVKQVCEVIVNVLGPTVILMPKGDALDSVVNGFLTTWKIPQCAGAIDGSHIPIIRPNKHGSDYYNRKGFYSVILQAVVSHEYKFMNVYPGWPGSVHDARVFKNSKLYKQGSEGKLFAGSKSKNIQGLNVGPFLIGDPAYPLLPWLMKPYSDNGKLAQVQSHFNFRVSSARMVVENAFGRLKGRWRSLLKRNDTSLKDICIQITACCVLHNLCEERKEIFLSNWLLREEGNITTAIRSTGMDEAGECLTGEAVRNALGFWFLEN